MSRANESSQMFNMRCPCGQPAGRDFRRQHQGEDVYFCSQECCEQWDHFSDADKAQKLRDVKAFGGWQRY
jgi:hypothetical protein